MKVIKECPPIIGVLGGVGPMAGVLFHTKIIENTNNIHNDQDHLSVIHFSLPKYIGDRQQYLEHARNKENNSNTETKENDNDNCNNNRNNKNKRLINPGASMGDLANAMAQAAIALESQMIVCVPCNTFHTPLIWDEFVKCIDKTNKETEYKVGKDKFNINKIGYLNVIHMIELTLEYIQSIAITKNINVEKNVGLLCANGTRKTKLYDNIAMNKFGIKIVQIDDKNQKELHDAIFDPKDGIKILSAASPRVVKLYQSFVKQLKKDKECNVIILGCTEIPIALPQEKLFDVLLVDPMTVMAKHVVKMAKEIDGIVNQ